MSQRINISFKNTTKDMKLLARLKQEEEISDFVKRALEFYIKYLDRQKE